MIAIGNKRALYKGLWIISGLLLVGYNGFTLVSMFDPLIVGKSPEMQLVNDNWRRLKERASFASGKEAFDLDFIFSKFVPGQEKKQKEPSKPKQDNQITAPEDELPILTGIIRSVDVRGTGRFLVVIGEKTYAENAEVKGYLIKKITEKGIALSKNGITRFVPTPEVYFSSDRSGSAEKAISATKDEGESSGTSK